MYAFNPLKLLVLKKNLDHFSWILSLVVAILDRDWGYQAYLWKLTPSINYVIVSPAFCWGDI